MPTVARSISPDHRHSGTIGDPIRWIHPLMRCTQSFSGGRVGIGHWSRFHRFFSHAAWEIDACSLALAKRVVTILALGSQSLRAVDEPLCRKRGWTLDGACMHHDPLNSSRSKAPIRWGHDWVVPSLILVDPWWAPTKVFA